MHHSYKTILALLLASSISVSAQLAQSTVEFEKLLGAPIKIHDSVPPSRLYMKDDLRVQASFEDGKAIAVIYQQLGSSGNEEITDAMIDKIYKLNGLKREDVVPMDLAGLGLDDAAREKLRGVYNRTKDRKAVILNDRAKKIFAVYEAQAFIKNFNK